MCVPFGGYFQLFSYLKPIWNKIRKKKALKIKYDMGEADD